MIPFGAAPADILENSEFLVTAGLLMLALGGGGFVIFLLDRWKKKLRTQSEHRSIDALSSYRAMYEQGEITQDEYHAIRGHLSSQARNELRDHVSAIPASRAKTPSDGSTGPTPG